MNRQKRFLALFLVMTLVVATLLPLSTSASNEPLTQAEALQTILRNFEVQILPLTEEEAGAYAARGITAEAGAVLNAAQRVGIISDSVLQPHQPVSREHALKYVINALNLRHSFPTDVVNDFRDANVLSEASKRVYATAITLGLINGYPDQTLRPNAPIRAVELDTILQRVEENVERITIVHTNDLHGRILYQETNGEMGLGKIGAVVNEQRAKREHVLVFDMGDTFHGTNYVNLNEGEAAVDAMNAIRYDAMVPGNHDFNFGYERLLEMAESLTFPMVSANVKQDGETILPAYTLLEVGDQTFALIGVTATDTPIKTHPDNVQGLVFEDEIETIRKIIAEIEQQADEIIILSHSGISVERAIAEAFGDEILLILGGHSHSTIEYPELINHTYVTQAYEHGKALGITHLLYHDGQLIGVNGSLLRDSATLSPAREVQEILDHYKEQIDLAMQEVVGEVDQYLDGSREKIRIEETNLGNYIADALRQMVDADVAFTNGGGIRASLEPGEVTLGDIIEVLPFDNYVIKLELTGEQIWRSLEHSVRLYPNQNGGFLHVSGIRFTFDPAQDEYGRVVDVLINGEPLVLDQTYTVATNDFLAAGGDGFEWLKDSEVLADTGERLSTALLLYLQSEATIPKVEGRIVVQE